MSLVWKWACVSTADIYWVLPQAKFSAKLITKNLTFDLNKPMKEADLLFSLYKQTHWDKINFPFLENHVLSHAC